MYKTEFEKVIFAVNISLDHKNQINGLFIEPYKEQITSTSNIVNALHDYPQQISAIISSYAKDFPNNTQLAIAIIENEKVTYYGIIKVNDTIKPIENHQKVFEIGSVTKVFTSTVLAPLVENGKISLNDEINTVSSFH